MSNNQITEQSVHKAVVSYFPESIDDDSRTWHIKGNTANHALAHIDIGATVTFALNDPSRPIGAYLEDRPAGRSNQDFDQIRKILAELFGDEAAGFMGRIPSTTEEDEELADWEREIFETEVSVEVKNPALARILGRLSVVDFVREESRHPYRFTEERKQEMIAAGASSLAQFHEQVQTDKDKFYDQNPVSSGDQLTAEEDKLLTQLSEWLVVPGLSGWINYRKNRRSQNV